MTPPTDSVGEKLGEIRGQLRELIHQHNNQAQKQDIMGEKLTKLAVVPDQLDKIDARLTSLETDRHKRDGAMGFGSWLLKTPLVTWVAFIALAAWTYFRAPPQ